MKKIILLLAWTLLIKESFCQSATTPVNGKDFYNHKYKSQKAISWVLIVGGVASIAIAGAVIEPIQYNICLFCENQPAQKERNDALPTTLALAGAAAIIASIPMFIIAHHSKIKAASIGFKTQELFLPDLVLKPCAGFSLLLPIQFLCNYFLTLFTVFSQLKYLSSNHFFLSQPISRDWVKSIANSPFLIFKHSLKSYKKLPL